jgi:hypothetical protein
MTGECYSFAVPRGHTQSHVAKAEPPRTQVSLFSRRRYSNVLSHIDFPEALNWDE